MCSSTGIGHYNGIDFETIYKKPDPDISGGFIIDKPAGNIGIGFCINCFEINSVIMPDTG